MIRSRALVAAIAAGSFAGCGGAEPAPAGDEPIAVTTAAVEARDLRQTLAVAGTAVTAASAEQIVYAPETATVTELPFEDGSAVATGDVLARFGIASLSQELATRQAAIVDANVRAGQAQADLDKMRPLFERGLVSRNEFEGRQAALLAAQAAVTQAKAQLDVATLQQERAVVRARFAGVVAGRWHAVGDLVAPGTTDPILRVIDPTQLQVVGDVGLSDFDRLRPGMTATLILPESGAIETATVTLSPRPTDPARTTAEVRFSPQAKSALALNMAVRVELVIDDRPGVLVVPELAVRKDGDRRYVMLAGADGIARMRDVRIGLVTQSMAQVLSGVDPGDRVITTALELIQDGTPVRVTR